MPMNSASINSFWSRMLIGGFESAASIIFSNEAKSNGKMALEGTHGANNGASTLFQPQPHRITPCGLRRTANADRDTPAARANDSTAGGLHHRYDPPGLMPCAPAKRLPLTE